MKTGFSDYPPFLESYTGLKTHFEEQFHDKNSYERGAIFARFTERLIPLTQLGKDFPDIEQQQASHDEGADFIGEGPNNTVLVIQAKYTLKGVDSLDSIFSKFHSLEQQRMSTIKGKEQIDLFAHAGVRLGDEPTGYYQIITMHDLSTLLEKYEKSRFASIEFYNRLKSSSRLEVIDGRRILSILQTGYRKTNFVPLELELQLSSDIIQMDDVYIGVTSSDALKEMYVEHGDSLFFENLRDFLNATEVNEEIKNTVVHSPERLLSLNNGIVFKSSKVEILNPRLLRLSEASLVNGCQTTLTIVKNATRNCHVVVKIVRIDNDASWDITRAANFQNQIKRFDLELAQFLRPQIVKKMASEQSLGYSQGSGPLNVLDAIYEDEIVYEELRSLFIGIFSSQPNNIFDTEHTELLPAVLNQFFTDEQSATRLFEQLFAIHKASSRIARKLQNNSKKTSDIYRRFFTTNKTAYRAFFTLLAICAATQTDISVTKHNSDRYKLVRDFLEKALYLVQNDEQRFRRYYRLTLQVVSAAEKSRDKHEVQQYLWKYMRQTGFSVFLERVNQQAAVDDDLSD